MKLEISINLEGAAFIDDPTETPRILRQLADRLSEERPMDGLDRMIQDINGNTCGTWGIYAD